ncbi:MAG: lipid II flippase Amj family protein [Phycisphaerae bacterium]|nr:lipid II flippase Amj family protein [Phycisphaerae bacterium]
MKCLKLLFLHGLIISVLTIGSFSALYAALQNPALRLTLSTFVPIITGIGTILLGQTSLNTKDMPRAGAPILNTLGYFMHAGGHGYLPSDWDVFFQYMTKHLK